MNTHGTVLLLSYTATNKMHSKVQINQSAICKI